MFEVQKHLALTEHGYLGYAVIANKKFWEGLPADVRGQLEAAMKESTTYANKIAKEQNDKDLEAVKKTGKTQVYVPDSRREAGLQEGAGAGACEDGVAHRQGPPAVGVQGDRFRSDQALSTRRRQKTARWDAWPRRAFFQAGGGVFHMKILDHLEEWLITFLMAAATTIIFVSVVHRYLSGCRFPVCRTGCCR
jgi:hypothetical protein